jgi:RNA polymerase sigma-70 factor (ECF subfamily)
MVMDKKQFTDILDMYQTAVISVLYKMINSWETARDLAQDAFINLWHYRDKIDEEKPIFTLLYKIAVNLAIDQIRKTKKNYVELDNNLNVSSVENLDNRELYQLILAISDRLKPKQKAIFILRDIEGFTFEEIKSIMNMPIGNIRSNLHLARKNIKIILESEYNYSQEMIYEL